jgi:hypothetical protein
LQAREDLDRTPQVPARSAFFGGLPERGPWTAVGLGRTAFLAILGISVALFVFVDGPVWAHLHDRHAARIAVSYGIVPVGVVVALRREGRLRPAAVAGATAVIALLKLVLTAGLLVALALAR